jgi:hypothetical protein
MIGRLYKITSPSTPLVYIGSTTTTLATRLTRHNYTFKTKVEKCSSHQIIEFGDAIIELIQELVVEDRFALYQLEYALQAITPCVNFKDGQHTERGRTFEARYKHEIIDHTPEAAEWRTYMRAYRAKNKQRAVLQSRKDSSKCQRRKTLFNRQCRAFYPLADFNL